uniref:Uncharacterized protein n=1 Tax=Arundo donax TaxID=35708 RepID=A0A0A9C4D5_ARUDO
MLLLIAHHRFFMQESFCLFCFCYLS